MNIIKSLFEWLVFAILIAVAGFLLISSGITPLQYKAFTVMSGSMEPAIPTGSVVIVTPAQDYKLNEIITFATSPTETTTHRIRSVNTETDKTTFTTKGDANEESDLRPVLPENVRGKVAYSIPYLGYFLAFTKTKHGVLALIIAPAAMIILTEIYAIISEIAKAVKNKTGKGRVTSII